MRRTFVYAALLALAGITPAMAERVYVPVIGVGAEGNALATQVWVTRGAKATRVATATDTTLLSFEAKRAGDVYAWVADRNLTLSPVIAESDAFHAGAQPGMAIDQAYDQLLVGAANLGDAKASCQAMLYDGDREVARIPFEVNAKSVYREDAAPWTSTRATSAQVSCDQQFYPLAAATTNNGSRVIFGKAIGPNGDCASDGKPMLVVPASQSDGSWVVDVRGIFHQASLADPKGIVCVRAPADLNGTNWRIGKLIIDWDVTLGDWWAKKPSGIHNMGYYFGNRYRSGVIGNFNGLGPGKYLIKNMNNFGFPRGSNSTDKESYQLVPHTLYHVTYTYDANNRHVHVDLQDSNHNVLKSLDQDAQPGNGQTMVLQKYSSSGVQDMMMVSEFGNYNALHTSEPEVPTPGWLYANLHLHFIPK
jgi:hypothetical protein